MKRLNLRTLRYLIIAYVLFDLYIGGNPAGFIPLTPLAAAQFTQVSGTVIDPNGLPYANGTISAALVTSASPFFTATHIPYTPPSAPVGLNSAGSFTMQLADNTQLSPGGTTWNFTVNCGAGCVPPAGGAGPISFRITGLTISGASQSISAQLQAAAPSLVTPVGTLQFAGVPSGACNAGQTAVNNTNGNFYWCNGGTWSLISAAAGAVAFSSVTAGTNTLALVIGNSGSFTFSGTGIINANQLNGTLLSGLGAGVLCNTVTTGVPFLCAAGNFPTLNQNTTGTSAGAPFSGITTGANTAALTIGAGGSLTFSGSGTINANQLNGTALSGLGTGILKNTTGTGVPSIAVAGDFPTLNQSTTGNAATATTATSATSATTASQLNGGGIPLSKTIVGTNGSGQLVDATGSTLTNNTSGNAGTATAFAVSPATCGAGIAATGITSNGTPVGCFTPVGTINGMVAGEPVIGQSSTSAIASQAYIDAYALFLANGSTWSMCKAITQSFLAMPTNNSGVVDARGFQGNQGCPVADATGSATNGMFPNANCQTTTVPSSSCNGANVASGKLLLGNVNWYLPVVSSEAGYTGGGAGSKQNYERLGTVIVPPSVVFEGIGTTAAGLGANTSNIIACQSAGYNGVAACVAPAATEVYQISSLTVTQETAAPGRQYMAITTATTNDLVGGAPFRISGASASGNANMVDFNGSYTACEASAYSDVVTDPSCGGGAGGQSSGVSPTFTIYAPVPSGLTSVTITAVGSGYGGTAPTCTVPTPGGAGGNAGGVQATLIATVSGGSVNGLYIQNRGTGYPSGVTAGTVTCTGNATATFQTIPSSCTRGANVNCGNVYGELPLLHAMAFKQGTSAGSQLGAGVSMGDQFLHINIDCKFNPTCVGLAGRSIQEQSQLKDMWAGNSPDRDVEIHGFASQNADNIHGLRVTISSLANRQKTVTNGAYTFGSGTLTLTTGSNTFIPNGIVYIFGSPANIGCAKSTQSTVLPTYPTYIPLPVISNTGTVVTLDDSGTACATSGSGTDTYQIGETCEPGKEGVLFGDVGPHGLGDTTVDISGCANTGNFQVAVNAAYRFNVSSTSSDYGLGAHAEGAIYGVLAGDSGPFRGFNFLSWAGVATGGLGGFTGTNQAGGAYQNEQSASAIKIRSEYFVTTSGPATTDYIIQNIQRNNANTLYYTINDDNPVNATATDGGHIQDAVTTLYAVDVVPSCPNGISTQNLLTTASIGSVMGCNMAIGTAKGGNALIFQGQTGGTAATFTANTVGIFGNYYNQNLIQGVTHFNWNVANPDNTADLYDFGLYGPCAPGNATCPLLVHLGATAGTSFAPSAGLRGGAVAIIPAIATIPPGNYYIAGTCNATCTATLVTGPAQMQLVAANSATASSGGALPASIAIPAAAITSASVPQSGIH